MKINRNLLEEIKDYEKETFNETFLIIYYSLKTYFYSLTTFGLSSPITKDCLNIIKEFIDINKYESKVFKYIINNIETIKIDIAELYIDEMNERKEREILYYYQVLDDIEEACDMQTPYRAKRMKKDYLSIKDDENFNLNIHSSSYTLESLMDYLSFTKDIKDFINTHTIIEYYELTDEDMFGINYKVDENNVITDIKLILPVIEDYKTLKLNVNLLMKAYYLYNSLSLKTPINLEEIEVDAKEKENSLTLNIPKQL